MKASMSLPLPNCLELFKSISLISSPISSLSKCGFFSTLRTVLLISTRILSGLISELAHSSSSVLSITLLTWHSNLNSTVMAPRFRSTRSQSQSGNTLPWWEMLPLFSFSSMGFSREASPILPLILLPTPA